MFEKSGFKQEVSGIAVGGHNKIKDIAITSKGNE